MPVMKADREPNRLPLRAGAMLLLAVAVLFLALPKPDAHAARGDVEPALALLRRAIGDRELRRLDLGMLCCEIA